ncbi:hypothetical protein FSP39_018130 [Pinctada imbricata]|uniref:F-box domain-containing protein n=1 Tax=Pinctada imbricata TaxID=66713 RepID=A0AA88Y855_PINIB|nr:hypothetical protein FSP39_018130 [Pinctada imbricata]
MKYYLEPARLSNCSNKSCVMVHLFDTGTADSVMAEASSNTKSSKSDGKGTRSSYPPRDSLSQDEYQDVPEPHNTEEDYEEDDPLTLDTLPVELLMYISNFLDAKFLIHTLSKVCQVFHDLLTRDIYWKTRISKRWPKPYPPVYDEKFSWQEACIMREEQHKMWTNQEELCHHLKYREGIFAPVDAVHLMKNGRFLVSGSRDRYLNVVDLSKYDPENSSSIKQMKVYSNDKAHKGWIWSVASNSDDSRMCTGSWDTYIKTWDVWNDCTEINKYKCRSAVLSLHMEENTVIGAGYDQQIYTIDTRTNDVHRKKYHRRPVLSLKADDKYVISGSEDKTVAIFDRRAGHVYKTIQMESYAMDLSFGHQQLWISDKEGKIHLYDATLGQFEFIQTYDVGHTGKATGIIYTPGALFTCSTDKTIKILEPSRNPGPIQTLTAHDAEVARIFYQDNVLVSAGSDTCVGIWMPKSAF